MFIDNHFGLKDLIATTNSVMFPVDPDKPYTPVAIADLAKVAGAILAEPELHKDKTYHIASDRFTMGELAKVCIDLPQLLDISTPIIFPENSSYPSHAKSIIHIDSGGESPP